MREALNGRHFVHLNVAVAGDSKSVQLPDPEQRLKRSMVALAAIKSTTRNAEIQINCQYIAVNGPPSQGCLVLRSLFKLQASVITGVRKRLAVTVT